MAADQAQFETLLQNLMSTSNDVRSQSEETYESIPPASKIPLLISSMQNAAGSLETRTMAAVLLRRIYLSTVFEDFWPQLGPEIQGKVKHEMLACVQQESNPLIRKKMCDATAEFARNMFDDDGNMTWPEILKFLFDCASSPDAGLRESALNIFSTVPGIFGNQQAQHLGLIKQMLQQCSADQKNIQVRFAAAKATVSFLLSNEGAAPVLNHFKDLLPSILQAVADSITASQEDDTLMKALIDLAENCPKYLRPQLENTVNLCMKIIADANMSSSLRQLALEVMVTLSETAPAMIRKFGKFLEILVPQVLSMMVDLEEEPDWAVSDELEEEDNDSNAIAGESALDRLARNLGGRTILPHIIGNVPRMLENQDWKYRHAALMAISACGEGCEKQMRLMLGDVVGAVLPFLQDSHPRVRYAACNAVGQMATDFGPEFQTQFHEKVVPGLLMVLDDNKWPRVQTHAGAALVNFTEACPKNIIIPYLDPVIAKLEQVLTSKFKELLEQGNKLVLEQVLTTLASVADTAEEKFVDYYDRFMPMLKYIVENATEPQLRVMRGKAIECISFIGLAVGRDKFLQDGNVVMELLLKSQTEAAQEELEDDDPTISYMISSWARMCKIMGKDFEQYLPLVMGPVLKAAALKPEVALVDEDDVQNLENDDWQFVTLGDQQSFGIKTAGLEEKNTACQMLVCYARELKESFVGYTEQVAKIMVNHLKFYFHDGVRVAAAECLPCLLDCALIRGPEYIATMWQFMCPEILKAIDAEPEVYIKAEHIHCLAECIEKMGKGCLNDDQVGEMIKMIDVTLKEHTARQNERQEERKDEDYDDVVEEALMEQNEDDVYVLRKISDLIHAMFGTHKEAFLPVFEQLLPHCVTLIQRDRPWADKQWGLCIFDDLIEHTGPLSLNYQQYFLKSMLEYICDSQAEVRQAAAYGVGVMAQFGGEGYAHACAEAVPLLFNVVQDPESRTLKKLSATENAIAAVAKICKYNAGSINLAEVLPLWISWLPTWEDEEEAQHIYKYFCELIENNNVYVLGENHANLPRILKIIAEVFIKEVFESGDEVSKRLINIIKQIESNGEIMQACLQELVEEHRLALANAVTNS